MMGMKTSRLDERKSFNSALECYCSYLIDCLRILDIPEVANVNRPTFGKSRV